MSGKVSCVCSLALITISFLSSMSCSRQNEEAVEKSMYNALRSKDDNLLKSATFRMIRINPNNLRIFSHNRSLIDKDQPYRDEVLRLLEDASRNEANRRYGVMLNIARIYGRVAVKPSELTGMYDATSGKDLITEHVLRARKSYEKALELAETDEEEYAQYTALNMYGQFLIQIGMFGEAERIYRKCLEVGHRASYANSFLGIGRALYFAHNHDEASDYFVKAIEADEYSWAPRSYVTTASYTFLGLIACNRNRLDEAVQYLRKSGRGKKSAFNAVFDLVLCRELIGKGRGQDVAGFLEALLADFNPNNVDQIKELLESLRSTPVD